MRIPTIITVFLSMILLPQVVSACSCVMMASGNPPCQSFWSAPVVFSGRVTEIKSFTADKGYANGFEQRIVRFIVQGDHRGGVGATAEVVTGRGGGDCGFSFKTGEDYLVYAYRDDTGQLSTGICTQTKQLSAATEDMAYIVSLSGAKAIGSIFGMVNQYIPKRSSDDYQSPPPMANVRITAEGKNGKIEATTDDNGKFRLTDLLPGEYVLKMATPEGFTGSKETKVTIPEKGCAVTDFMVTRENSFSGRVLDSVGDPVSRILVDLVPVDQIRERYYRDRQFVVLDENGSFDFRSIAPGTYYLGVRLSPGPSEEHRYPRTFYPGTPLLENAVSIVVVEGAVTKGLDFQLPPKLSERKVEGIVVFPDGKPVPGALLGLDEGTEIGGHGYAAGPDGQFSITILQGLTYRVRAWVNLASGGQQHAEPVDIPAKGNLKDVKLVISEPGGSCAKCRR